MKNKFNVVLLAFLFTSCSLELFAQPPQEGERFWDKVFFGGNFGLQFGDQTVVDVNPLVGYRLTEKLSVGFTVTYVYYRFKDPYNYFPSYSSNIYGGSLFTRYFLLENIFAHVEGEMLNLEVPNYFLNRYERENVFGFYVGGGYRQPLGDRSSLNILLLYNLNEDRNSPYQNPIIRIGFGFGI
jgi:hypothetical protein